MLRLTVELLLLMGKLERLDSAIVGGEGALLCIAGGSRMI